MSMKKALGRLCVCASVLLTGTTGCHSSYLEPSNGISVSTPQGELSVQVLQTGAIRVQCVPQDIELPTLEELTYAGNNTPDCKVYVRKKGNILFLNTDKGNLLNPAIPEVYVGKYKGQLDCYEQALVTAGKNVLGKYLFYPMVGVLVKM